MGTLSRPHVAIACCYLKSRYDAERRSFIALVRQPVDGAVEPLNGWPGVSGQVLAWRTWRDVEWVELDLMMLDSNIDFDSNIRVMANFSQAEKPALDIRYILCANVCAGDN